MMPSVPISGFDFGGLDFPPLSKTAGVSNSNSNSNMPPTVPGSAILPPGSAVDVPCPVRDVVSDSLPNKASWASLVSENLKVMNLSYFKPNTHMNEGRVRLLLPPDIAINGAATWANTIVGFFLDKLPFSVVRSYAHRLWESKGLLEVLSNDNGFFFFKFSQKAELSRIIEGGPWYFGGRPIFLKPWRPGMNLSKDGCRRVPIWAHFYNVPLEFWNAAGLSHIASTVGIPLHADIMTSNLKRLSYARICLEICYEDSLPTSLDLVLDDGSVVEILIEYKWLPMKCSVCMEFGHLPKSCKQSARQLWIPKPSHNTALPVSDDAPKIGMIPRVAEGSRSASLPDHGSVKLPESMDGRRLSSSKQGTGSPASGGCDAVILDSSDLGLDICHDSKEGRRSCSSRLVAGSSVPDGGVGVDGPSVPGGGVEVNPFVLLHQIDDANCPDSTEGRFSISPRPVAGSVGSGGGAEENSSVLHQHIDDPTAKRELSEGCSGLETSPIGPENLPDPVGLSNATSGDELKCQKSNSGNPIAAARCVSMEDSPICSNEPSSSSSYLSTPLLARRLNMVDELDKKQGKKMKHKKKKKNAGNSKMMVLLTSDD